jgi:hypothetical protein
MEREQRTQHQLLSMIEAAQRAGHSEEEIVAIVEEHLGDEAISEPEHSHARAA